MPTTPKKMNLCANQSRPRHCIIFLGVFMTALPQTINHSSPWESSRHNGIRSKWLMSALMLGKQGMDIDGQDEALRNWLAASEAEPLGGRTTSTSSDSSSDSDVRPLQPTKKRKSTYYQRKHEIDELREEASELELELRRLTPITGLSGDVFSLRGFFQRDIERNNLRLAGAQAMLSSHFSKLPTRIPLTSHIRLPKDGMARFKTLESLRDSKLESALQFMTERTRPLDLTQFHREFQTIDFPGGDFVYTGCDVYQFTGGHSVRQVFDEFIFYGANQEMSVTEAVGMLTIRESGEVEDVSFGQSVVVAKVAEGLEVEANVAVFSACIDAADGRPAYAISAVDFVNEDELHPYQPESRGRKEIVAAVLFSEMETPNGRVVAMSRWSHIHFRMPRRELSEDLEDTVRESMMQWCGVMPQFIRERLAMQAPAP